MKYFLLFQIFIFLLSAASYGQNDKKLVISIRQHVFPYGTEVCYIVNYNNIKVYKTTKRDIKVLKCIRTLARSEIDSVKVLMHNIFSHNYNGYYAPPVLDGVTWKFELALDATTKTYDISNCRLKPLEDLINYLNSTVPRRRRYIRMDWFKRDYCE
jgi:hypothetical protein